MLCISVKLVCEAVFVRITAGHLHMFMSQYLNDRIHLREIVSTVKGFVKHSYPVDRVHVSVCMKSLCRRLPTVTSHVLKFESLLVSI